MSFATNLITVKKGESMNKILLIIILGIFSIQSFANQCLEEATSRELLQEIKLQLFSLETP